jgi:hypothetical protein
MWKLPVFALALVLALPGQAVRADDLTGSNRFLCAAVQATECQAGGDCGIDLPWNLNIPQFIEIDLDAMHLATTEASAQNRATAIEHVSRQDGVILLQGYEMGRGYTFVIAETTGQVTATIATEGRAVIVFGACTPLPAVPGGK